MQVNRISNINFKENVLSQEMDSQGAILMLRDSNASVKFRQNQEIAGNADTMSSTPLKALGYKLYRTFSIIKGDEPVKTQEEKHLNTLA